MNEDNRGKILKYLLVQIYTKEQLLDPKLSPVLITYKNGLQDLWHHGIYHLKTQSFERFLIVIYNT